MAMKLLVALLVAALCANAPALPADALDRPIELAEIDRIVLEQRPAFGNREEMLTYQAELYPATGMVVLREVRQHDRRVLREETYTAPRASMEVLARNIEIILMLPENLETDVLDGHYTYITLELASGYSARSGGLVAEEYGPKGFQTVYRAIEEVCRQAIEGEAAVPDDVPAKAEPSRTSKRRDEPLRPVLLTQYVNHAWEYVHYVRFIDQFGDLRIMNMEDGETPDGSCLDALLAYIADDGNSLFLFAYGDAFTGLVGEAIAELPGEGAEISMYADDAGLLCRYAFIHGQDGAVPILLSVDGDEMGRIETPQAKMLCAFLDGIMPAKDYFGEGFGHAYTESDMGPLRAHAF